MAPSSDTFTFVADAVDALTEGFFPHHRKLFSCKQGKPGMQGCRTVPPTNGGWEEINKGLALSSAVSPLRATLHTFLLRESPGGGIKSPVSPQGNTLVYAPFIDFSPFPLLRSQLITAS